jgi:hypothetical protein
MVRRAGEADDQLITAAQNKTRLELEARFRERADHMLKDYRDGHLRKADEAIKFLDAMKAALGEGYLAAYSVPDIAAAYHFVRKSGLGGASHGTIENIAKTMEENATRLRKALAEAGFESTKADAA